MVRIAHASINEKGKVSGGKNGDQTKKEVCVRNWYASSKGWQYVIRCNDPVKANIIATTAEDCAKNDYIGYAQDNRNSLLKAAEKVNYDITKIRTMVACDCSSMVHVCVNAAEIKLPYEGNCCTTRTLRKVLSATGKFTVLKDKKYLTIDKYLKRGDIILREGSHVVVVLDDGEYADGEDIPLKITSAIKSVQAWLNVYYKKSTVKVNDDILIVDGKYGTKTKRALVAAMQTEMNRLGAGLVVDGSFGSKSEAAWNKYAKALKKNSKGIFVTLWQCYLVCNKYNPNGIDGKFGNGCANATKQCYKDNKLSTITISVDGARLNKLL